MKSPSPAMSPAISSTGTCSQSSWAEMIRRANHLPPEAIETAPFSFCDSVLSLPLMHVVIFEASRWHHFAPLSLSRPLFTMASGASTLLQKQIRHLRPTRLTLWVRPELEQFCRERIAPKTGVPTEVNRPLDEEPAMLLNGRMVHFERIEHPPHSC